MVWGLGLNRPYNTKGLAGQPQPEPGIANEKKRGNFYAGLENFEDKTQICAI